MVGVRLVTTVPARYAGFQLGGGLWYGYWYGVIRQVVDGDARMWSRDFLLMRFGIRFLSTVTSPLENSTLQYPSGQGYNLSKIPLSTAAAFK